MSPCVYPCFCEWLWDFFFSCVYACTYGQGWSYAWRQAWCSPQLPFPFETGFFTGLELNKDRRDPPVSAISPALWLQPPHHSFVYLFIGECINSISVLSFINTTLLMKVQAPLQNVLISPLLCLCSERGLLLVLFISF